MIDSLEMLRGKIENQKSYLNYGLKPRGYGVATLHRPSNVDDPAILKKLCGILSDISQQVPLVFPVHPRTRKNMEQAHLLTPWKAQKTCSCPNPSTTPPS